VFFIRTGSQLRATTLTENFLALHRPKNPNDSNASSRRAGRNRALLKPCSFPASSLPNAGTRHRHSEPRRSFAVRATLMQRHFRHGSKMSRSVHFADNRFCKASDPQSFRGFSHDKAAETGA
jgi:hypothetical protein